MNRWLIYMRERFPQILWGTLPIGAALSGGHLDNASYELLPFLLSAFGGWVFLFTLRLMDDLKDFAVDSRLYPHRPLPRGLISKKEAAWTVVSLQLFLTGYAALCWVFLQSAAGLAYFFLAFFALLFWRDFFIPGIFASYPFVKGVALHLFAFPLAFFVVGASQPEHVVGLMTLAYGMVLFGSFLIYDIARKLNPESHPALGTYIHFHGFNQTFIFSLLALAISGIGAYYMDIGLLLWPVEIIVLATLSVLFFDMELYHAPEYTATLSLVIHVWSGIF